MTIDSTCASLSIDSLDGMELAFEFEEAFTITISNEARERDVRAAMSNSFAFRCLNAVLAVTRVA